MGVTRLSRGGGFGEESGPAPAPSDAEVTEALTTIRHRVRRLLVRRGLEPGDDATEPVDRLEEESAALAGIVGASVQGRVALGPRAGARVRRLGPDVDLEAVTSRGPRQAHLEGFDLHVLRPPFAQERLRSGTTAVSRWSSRRCGTTARESWWSVCTLTAVLSLVRIAPVRQSAWCSWLARRSLCALCHRAPTVRVWQVTSRGRRPRTGRPPPDVVHVAYPLPSSTPWVPECFRPAKGYTATGTLLSRGIRIHGRCGRSSPTDDPIIPVEQNAMLALTLAR